MRGSSELALDLNLLASRRGLISIIDVVFIKIGYSRYIFLCTIII
jgi:hypothetical protein